MAVLAPFRAWRYNPERIQNLDEVVAPPYDVIDPDQQRRFYDRHPLNVIRLILGEIFTGDNESDNRYTRAAGFLERWRRDGTLVKDNDPTIYLSQESFTGPDGRMLKRRGFIALIHLEPLDGGMVFPHEATFPKHRVDRLNLMRSCHTHFNPILSMFSDPQGELAGFLQEPVNPPDARTVDDDGVVHEIWSLREKDQIQAIIEAMADKRVFLADGHHRYETCLKYLEEVEAEAGPRRKNDPSRWTLMYFTPMEGEGLAIFPVHKMVQGIIGFAAVAFLDRLREFFIINEIPIDASREGEGRERFLRTLGEEREHRYVIGLAIEEERFYRILTPKDPAVFTPFLSQLPECLRALDITLLHEIIFRVLLGIDVADPGDQHLSFLHDAQQTLDLVQTSKVQMAFIMNPTRIDDLRTVATSLCKMPQKATYFYPKMRSGLVMNIMEAGESVDVL
jgi:uncharacterized protein (DUF1015 family)